MDHRLYNLGYRLGNLQRIDKRYKRLPSQEYVDLFFKDLFQGNVPAHIQAKITLSDELPRLYLEPVRNKPRVEEAQHARDALKSIAARILTKAHNTKELPLDEVVRQWNKSPHRQPLLVGVNEDDDEDLQHPAQLVVACSESERFLYALDGILCGGNLSEGVKRYAQTMSDQYHTPFSVYRGRRDKI